MMTWPDTRLTDLFGIELPIVQAPMANASAVDMAVAVANAGGLGSFPCASLTDDKVAEGVASIRARTNRPINLNFFCHTPAPADEARDAAWLKRLAPYYAELGAEISALKEQLAADGASEEEIAEDADVAELTGLRTTVMNASFLRASLFTSVVAFGVAALVVGLGIVFLIVGWALRSLGIAVDADKPVVAEPVATTV